jgi:hypothetical protein
MAEISLTFSTGLFPLPRIQPLEHTYHLIKEKLSNRKISVLI